MNEFLVEPRAVEPDLPVFAQGKAESRGEEPRRRLIHPA